jgi:predicted  nucleic acid-binding Zn-ribbon protein
MTKVHPAANSYRLMRDDELAALAADIESRGQIDPIILGRINGAASDVLVDGRNRLAACKLAQVDPQFQIIEFEDDEAVRAFVKSRSERRDLTKGEKAMGLAFLFPEPERGRGKKDEARKEIETSSFSYARVKQARAVLRHSRELAEAVRDGTIKLDDALERIKNERKELESAETKLARLRAEAPDLADLVNEDRIALNEAYSALEQRQHEAAEKEKSLRETLFRSAEAAFGNITSWASDEFVAEVYARVEDAEFRETLIKRVRLGSRPLDDIERGAAALAKLLAQLGG